MEYITKNDLLKLTDIEKVRLLQNIVKGNIKYIGGKTNEQNYTKTVSARPFQKV